ncbi:maleylpyruvate isomerase N-terminal domain-containing protein [Nonomuraea sp. NPDC004580]|uniref:maleylpyruvate isomerase N-terminal domain-containing protein n=1 Tax=Nonomuraea sp. NPDC004580 TaxID=3154552 RepID=UPI0033A1A709
MIVPITPDSWMRVRRALDATTDRFAELLVAARAVPAKATVHWSVGETAAHVATLSRLLVAITDPGAGPFPFSGGKELVRETVVDTVARLNEVLLGEFTERDPAVLARLIRADISRTLEATEAVDPVAAVPWLGGARLPHAGLLAHMVNELQIHGWDIARGARLPWTVPPQEAGLFFDLFLLGVIHYGYGRLLEGHGPVPRGRITVEFSSPYTASRVIALTGGSVTVEQPNGRPDARLSFDPVTLNLMLFGRISKSRAALTGKVAVRGGRRPWRLPAFMRIVRLPS